MKPRTILLAVAVIVALLWVWAVTGCGHLTVSPEPVNAKVVAWDENSQNAGIIDCDAGGCIVTPNWYARYKELEAEFKRSIAADASIKRTGEALTDGRYNYRISYEVFNNFAEMKASKRGP